jgi:hypothetical protein
MCHQSWLAATQSVSAVLGWFDLLNPYLILSAFFIGVGLLQRPA